MSKKLDNLLEHLRSHLDYEGNRERDPELAEAFDAYILLARQRRKPDVTAKVYLVEHGYQLDLFDENGKKLGFECRDFGGDYPVDKMQNVAAAAMIATMQKCEDAYNKTYPAVEARKQKTT